MHSHGVCGRIKSILLYLRNERIGPQIIIPRQVALHRRKSNHLEGPHEQAEFFIEPNGQDDEGSPPVHLHVTSQVPSNTKALKITIVTTFCIQKT